MAVMTPFFDIVAGVAILAGRSSLLDAKVFQAANTTITFRQLLALGFIGYGGWNLWKVEKAQDKLKESLESEEGWEDYPTITYQVFGIDDLADAENMSYWYEGGDYSEDDLDSAIQEAQTWWDERHDLDEDDGGGIVRVWVEEKSEHYGVGDNEGSVFTLEAESFSAEKDMCIMCKMKPIDYRNQQSQLDICPSDKCLRKWNNQWNAESFSAVVGGMRFANLLPVGTKVRSYDFWPYNKDTYIEGVIENIAPSPRCSPNCMHYHIRRTKSVRGGVEDREDLIGTIFMTHPYEDEWDADYEGQLAKHIIPFKSGKVSEIKGGESFAAMTKADVENRAAIKRKYRQEFKNWVKKPYPYEVRVTQDSKGDYCESCGDISARPEGEGVHYQFVLPRQDSWRSKYRWIEGDYCRGCGSNMCQICVDGDNYCDSCGELLCNSCRQEYENYGGDCPEIHYQAESFNAAYLQDPASEYGGPTEMILDTCPVCAEFSNDMTPKELWPRWGKDDDMGYMCDDCWDAMETDPNAQWIYTQEAESFAAEGIDGSRAKSEDYWLYHGHNSDGSWCGQKLWVSKGYGYDYLCSCNATLYRDDAVLSAKNPKKLPEPKDPKTTPYGTIFIHEFMSEAESFSADSLSEDEKILLKKLRDKRTDIPRKYRDALIDFQEKSGKKGGEAFSAESRDELIDTLIGIRQELARDEGMEDWENESEGSLDSLSSAFIQELIWYMDGDRDTWDAESFDGSCLSMEDLDAWMEDYFVKDTGFASDDTLDSDSENKWFWEKAVRAISQKLGFGVLGGVDERRAGRPNSSPDYLFMELVERKTSGTFLLLSYSYDAQMLHIMIGEMKNGKITIGPASWSGFSPDESFGREKTKDVGSSRESPIMYDEYRGNWWHPEHPFQTGKWREAIDADWYESDDDHLEMLSIDFDGDVLNWLWFCPPDALESFGEQGVMNWGQENIESFGADTFPSAEKTWTTYNAEQDSYGECGCGDHDVNDDDYDACETCGTIWEFPDCTSGLCGICFKVCAKCNPKKRKKHYQTCTLEG